MDYKIRTKVSRILIDDAVPADTAITVLGWVKTVRVSKAVAFVEINDGSCMGNLQAVVADPDKYPVLEKLLTGASVRVKGKLVASQGQGQKYELAVETLDMIGEADPTYPLQKKRHTFEYLREIAHLRPRTNTFGAVGRIKSKIAYAIHKYYQERGFFYVHTPLITSSDCEGAGDMFRVTTLDLDKHPAQGRQDRLGRRFLRLGNLPLRVGAARGRIDGDRAGRYLHIRADFPRRKLQHQPPCLGVLDDRTGNGLGGDQ